MSCFKVSPAVCPLRGIGEVPGDKSVSHRALLLGLLASGQSTLRNLSGGEDNRRTLAAVRDLGATIGGRDGALVIDGVGLDGLVAPPGPIDCGNSGTTMRLLSGILAAQRFPSRLVGDPSLSSRPMGRIIDPLRRMGARIEGELRDGEPYPPLRIEPADSPLGGIDFASPRASAQVKSTVLLAGLWAEGPTAISEPTRSRDHTERMLGSLGVPIAVEGHRVSLDPRGWDRRLPGRSWTIPADLSSAAFLLAAAAIMPGSEVTVRRVGWNPTRNGVVEILRAMGVDLSVAAGAEEGGEPVADLTARGSRLHATEVRGALVVRSIDELPLVAALAAHAAGTTVIADAAELRVKESDRIAAMAAALGALGVDVEERPDGMAIMGGRVSGGVVDSRGDHRIAMAAAVAALGATAPVIIEDTANVATSFPQFSRQMRALGATVEERD